MSETEGHINPEDGGPGVGPTDPDRGDEHATDPTPGPESATETQDYAPVPPTKHSTAGGTDSPPPPSGTGGDTESLAGLRSERDTAAFEPGDATASVPASSRDRGSTASFDLDPRFEDPESTLPPSANERGDGMPPVAGYEILQVLGTGGMGIVYKARQARLDRFVALKMILAGAGARPDDLARFEAEAQAVAAIEHPNIVRIFEIGEHDGLPYFSLEFLGGGSLAKKIGGKPQPVGEAARIVEVLARAMQVAHQHKVIHRDLKPSNVLLSADGTLKIADFGLVKRLDSDSGQTRSGSILGTPSYMAPEQANGETRKVGPASDQYALGAILYELLTGRPPFQGTSVLETLDLVRTKEPVPPSQLQPKMPRDIETICLKCLEKDPARRYPDVAALAEDLRRFQAGEPIVARPVSDVERLWRWCLRNQRVAALGTAVALLLVVVAVVLTVALLVVSGKNQALVEANTKAEDRRLLAERQRKVAETAARAANEQNRSAVDAQVELINLLEGKLRDVPALQDERERMLDKATKNLEAAAQAMTDLNRDVGWDPKDEERNWRSLARAHQRFGELNVSRNRFQDAMEQFRRVDAIVATLAAKTPDDLAAQTRLARSQRFLGFIALQHLADTEAAKQYFREALEINRACLAKQTDNDVYKQELANTLGQLSAAELLLGHLKEAHDLYDEEMAIRKSFSPTTANHVINRRELSGLYERLGQLNLRMGNVDDGRRFYELCRSLREQVAAEMPDFWPAVYDLARSYNNSGFLCLTRDHDPRGARVFFGKALDRIEKRSAADPSNVETKSQLAETLYYEATSALHAGDAAGAAEGYRRCLEIRQALATDPRVKMTQVDLIVALARCGQHDQAAKLAEALVATPPKDENLYFQAACGFALAAGAARNDAALVRQYTDRAVECLRKGKDRGWADVVTLETDPDLEPIRNDPAFQALLGEFKRPDGKRP